MARLLNLFLCTLLALFAITNTALAAAERANAAPANNDHRAIYQLVQQGQIVPLEDILKVLEKAFYGDIIEIELERDDGVYIYEIEMLGPNGQKVEFEFLASSGELLEMEGKRVHEMRKPGVRFP